MTALSELTVDDLTGRQDAQDRLITWLMRERDKVRAELARRRGMSVSELFPRPRYQSQRQRQWTDADRALGTYRQLVKRVAELPAEPSVRDLSMLIVDARRLIGERQAA